MKYLTVFTLLLIFGCQSTVNHSKWPDRIVMELAVDNSTIKCNQLVKIEESMRNTTNQVVTISSLSYGRKCDLIGGVSIDDPDFSGIFFTPHGSHFQFKPHEIKTQIIEKKFNRPGTYKIQSYRYFYRLDEVSDLKRELKSKELIITVTD